ncbi:DUF402 domain-containing protein [Rhizomonospora bruguierae]|uniref:DUF402 domain-containing protein n=1 Tax=Rhizomonospora bruguierae TaxID=1581705 RepID=UPI001BCC103D|nr:DUF402 domain-containing protein [Micromonospora sp. NBRC 107566]
MRFTPGEVILHRNVRRGRIAWVRPARVVSDDERGLLVWVARGTTVVNEAYHDGRFLRELPFIEWARGPHRPVVGEWAGPGVLKLMPPDAAHSVWWFRDDTDRFTAWYVNLEEPAVRWSDPGGATGVDMVDQDLDIVVRPDRTWEWKDEDEFTERLAHPGQYWVADEAAVRAEGERVVKLIEAGDFPFDGTWTDFHPDPAWPTPPLVPGWDRPPVIV